jgi:hypothetical protein
MHFNRFTLKFVGKDGYLEKDYLEDCFARSLSMLRFALLVGAFLYAFFGVLDAAVVPSVKTEIWFIRYLLVCPILLGVWGLSFTSWFKMYWKFVLAFVVLISGLGIIGMIAVSPPPGDTVYYAGLILVFLFGYLLFRIPFLWISGVCFVLIIVYEAVAIWDVKVSVPILISNNFFLITADIVGMFACYSLEFLDRSGFYLRHLLNSEKALVVETNKELEEKVRELKEATEKIRTLSGFIPICARCKKIRDDQGFWNQLEDYISRHSDAEFSHSLCPECAKALYSEILTDSEAD